MSYIRCGHPLEYVDGISDDYVFPTSYKKGKKEICYIEDYGNITNKGIIEILFRWWKPDDKYDILLKEHLLKILSKRLGVKLRKKKLTFKEYLKITKEQIKEDKFLFGFLSKARYYKDDKTNKKQKD